jgi:hypothetical protein
MYSRNPHVSKHNFSGDFNEKVGEKDILKLKIGHEFLQN